MNTAHDRKIAVALNYKVFQIGQHWWIELKDNHKVLIEDLDFSMPGWQSQINDRIEELLPIGWKIRQDTIKGENKCVKHICIFEPVKSCSICDCGYAICFNKSGNVDKITWNRWIEDVLLFLFEREQSLK
jgi:hypothetical protein